MVSLVSQNDVLSALRYSRNIVLTAYVLRPGAMRRALVEAAQRGAKVTVRLDGSPYKDDGTLLRVNKDVITALRRLGADAQLVDVDKTDGPPLHMKAIVADGVAFLDDRNWPDYGYDTIVRDDFRSDVRAVTDAALSRHGVGGRFFATDKADAVRSQARLLYSASGAREVEVESEAFGVSPQAYFALKKLSAEGVHCRLLVSKRDMASSPKMRHSLDLLAKQGVEIRVGTFDEKLAVVDGKRGWVGSANATTIEKGGDQIDWGLRTDNTAVVHGLDAHFQRNWTHSAPLADVVPG